MYIRIILISLLALLAQHCVKLYFIFGWGRRVFSHSPGACHTVEGIGYGSEDFHMLPNGITFITSGLRLQLNAPGYDKFYAEAEIKGGIYMFNFKNPKKVAQEMKMTSTKEFDLTRFQPHGISGWEESGKLYLFVVNHEDRGPDKVEKFAVSLDTLTLQHVKSYTDPLFRTLNGLAATGTDSFYFTNSCNSVGTVGRILESLALVPWANFGHVSGSNCRIVSDGILGANGIALSKDGRYIYVNAHSGQELRIYQRRDDNSVHLREVYPLHSFPDNVVVDPVTGDLYITLHPIYHQIVSHLLNPSTKAASQVLHIKLRDGSVSSVTELFVDEGSMISAASVTTIYNKKMLIGSVIDKLVYCDVNVPL